MFSGLKSLFKGPEVAGPARELRSFTTADPILSRDVVRAEDGFWSVQVADQQTIRLFEIDNPLDNIDGVEKCMLSYRAQLKSENVRGKAYLEMWCRLPGRGEFFSKGLHDAVKGSNDWASFEIPFYLKPGQTPDLIKLNLAVEGSGKIWIRDLQLMVTPLE